MKSAYWVFCAFKYKGKFEILTLGDIFHYLVTKPRANVEYKWNSGLENQANKNTNIFGFEKSSEYGYK